MEETIYMAFNCLNPDCGKLIKLPRPASSGIYAVTCPHCGIQKKFKLKGLDETATKTDNGKDNKDSSIPDNSEKDPIELQEDFVVGETYKVTCPHCKQSEFGFKTDKPGHRTIPCPKCKGKIGLEVRPKTKWITVTEQLQHYKGKLTLLKRGWLNKDYSLKVGKNIIGRYDDTLQSDISIKNDSSMSRRSIEIEVCETLKGYMFKLTVLNATNPVVHNNNILKTGDSIALNFGDIIILGKTRFRFDKEI